MREAINIYKKHKVNVDSFITNVIKSFPENYIKNAKYILENNRYIQLLYSVNSDFKQTSPVICKKKDDAMNIGSDKSHYFAKFFLDKNDIYISNRDCSEFCVND